VARFSVVDERRLRDILAALKTLVEGRPALGEVMAPLRELLGTDKTVAYAPAPRATGLGLDFLYGDGVSVDRVAPVFDAWLGDKTFGWTGYNPLRPEPSQRDVVLEMREIARWHDPRTSPIVRDVFPLAGLAGHEQLRVLLCDGPSLLSWLGAFQPARFDARQKRLLRHLVPALRRRLVLERAIAAAPRLRAALDAALEAMGTAAFVLNVAGGVAEANEAGRLRLAADRAGTLEALRAAVRRQDVDGGFDVTVVSSPGAGEQYLVVERRPVRAHVEPRIASAAARWSLTRRQAQVLALVAQGLPNRTIAATLGIAEGTVEVHLTAIFDKVGVANRSALVARVWES